MTTPWYYRRGFVYLLLALIGPLGLPLLWLSPQFSKKWKWGLTVLIVLLTLGLIIATQRLAVLLQSYGGTPFF